MKIRIQDNAVRFRITLKELEALNGEGAIVSTTNFPDGAVFRYAVRRTPERESACRCDGHAIELYLSRNDMAVLNNPEQEGVYLREEYGDGHRFMAFVEKDRPASRCIKPEEWIYEAAPGARTVTRPIGK